MCLFLAGLAPRERWSICAGTAALGALTTIYGVGLGLKPCLTPTATIKIADVEVQEK